MPESMDPAKDREILPQEFRPGKSGADVSPDIEEQAFGDSEGGGDPVGEFMGKAICGARAKIGRGRFVCHPVQASILPRFFP